MSAEPLDSSALVSFDETRTPSGSGRGARPCALRPDHFVDANRMVAPRQVTLEVAPEVERRRKGRAQMRGQDGAKPGPMGPSPLPLVGSRIRRPGGNGLLMGHFGQGQESGTNPTRAAGPERDTFRVILSRKRPGAGRTSLSRHFSRQPVAKSHIMDLETDRDHGRQVAQAPQAGRGRP